jgi:uncharacterized repeat protein (TIGR03847 family)
MARHIELNPVSHMTIGTVGVPGQRVFYLQGSKGNHLISLVLEKQQAALLADSMAALLEELEINRKISPNPNQNEQLNLDARLREPVEALFRVGSLGLGYSEDVGRVVVVAYEMVEEGEEPNVVSFWATPDQARALVPHVMALVKAGRPICGNCGRAIDQEGHFCPNRNGHLH